MKQLFLIILLLLGVIAGLFTLPLKDGAPILNLKRLQAQYLGGESNSDEFDLQAGDEEGSLDHILDQLPGPLGDEQARKSRAKVTFYLWRDSDGDMQYTDKPPPEGVAYKEQQVYTNVNIIPSVSAEGEEQAEAGESADEASGESQGLISSFRGKAQDIEETHRQRKQWMDRMSDP